MQKANQLLTALAFPPSHLATWSQLQQGRLGKVEEFLCIPVNIVSFSACEAGHSIISVIFTGDKKLT